MKTTAQVLREHALYSRCAHIHDLQDDTAFRIALRFALCDSAENYKAPPLLRRMWLLFVAESLENPC